MITLRIRSMMWFSAGLALALGLVWGTVSWRAEAAPGASESTIVAVTPVRVLDTRDPRNLGLPGPFRSLVAQKLRVTGRIPTSAGTTTVVPVGATGVLLNVTVVNPSAAGFLSIRPGDAAGLPSTSSLNFAERQVFPNAVQVALPTRGPNAGQIDIVYDGSGQAGPTTEVLIDIVGYTTSAGLQELVAEVALKANTADFGYATRNNAVTATSWASLTNRFVEVLCPPGMVATGGGGSNNLNGTVALTDSNPVPFNSASPTGWRAYFTNVTAGPIASATISAHVVCMRVPGQPGALVEGADDPKTADGT